MKLDVMVIRLRTTMNMIGFESGICREINSECSLSFPFQVCTQFSFFLTLEVDKPESKTFHKVGPENSSRKNYLSYKLQSYSEYALCYS